MEEQVVDLDVADGIATITLNRPERLNALNGAMATQLVAAIDAIDRDDAVRCAIVTGAGRAFCAGADLSRGATIFNDGSGDDGVASFRDGAGLITLRLYDCTKPVIGAINGDAVGVGASMTCAMDVRLMSSTARFGFVFVRRGMVPEGASGWFLPRLVGAGKALEWMLTGRLVDADEASRTCLVNAVHEPLELLPAAMRMAREIADHAAPVSATFARQLVWRGLAADSPMEIHKADSMATFVRGRSSDVVEGVQSFLEKRPPRFAETVPADLPGRIYPWWSDEEFPIGTPQPAEPAS
jgi:enoyl-CoA hydratase/carnithine racemase